MTPAMVGALIGFVLGFSGFVVLRMAASRIESRTEIRNGKQTAGILRMAALADWLIMIVVGYIVGPMVAGSN